MEAKARTEAKRNAPENAPPPKRARIESTSQWRVVPRNLTAESVIYNYPLLIEGDARIYVNAHQLAVYSNTFLSIIQERREEKEGKEGPPKFSGSLATWIQVVALVEEGCTQGPCIPTEQFFGLLDYLCFKVELIKTLLIHHLNTITPLDVPALKVPVGIVHQIWTVAGTTHFRNINFMRLFMTDTPTMMEATLLLTRSRT